MYSVKETFYTIQGEGFHSGRPAVFLRFAGCNLWTGREEDRGQAVCKFCDTDFVGTDGEGGGKFRNALSLAKHVSDMWTGRGDRFVVCTGGEPGLQLDEDLVTALHERGFEVAIETNGTVVLADGIDWVCVSPKAGSDVIVTSGNELKVVVPQAGMDLSEMESWDFDYFYVQPKDSAELEENTNLAVRHCLENPFWRLSIQTHKVAGIR